MSTAQTLGFKPYAKVNDAHAVQFATGLRQRLERKAYTEAETMLAQASDPTRARMTDGLASAPESVALSAQWGCVQPQSALANVLLGASLISSGWKIRGSSYADGVDKAAWAPFLDKLSSADEPLHKAIQLAKQGADACAWLIVSGVGMGAPRDALHDIYLEAISRVPLHWSTHYKYFMAFCEKWSGSHKEMFGFARESAKKAPRGHLLHTLTPLAFNEYALALTADSSAKVAYEKLRHPKYATEVVAALYAWLDATPDNLVDQLDNISGGFASHGLNQFGVALYMTGATEQAKAVLSALRGEVTTVPWRWIAKDLKEPTNPAFTYDRACRELGVTDVF